MWVRYPPIPLKQSLANSPETLGRRCLRLRTKDYGLKTEPIFDNLVEPTKGVHGVVVTHLLAKEELRVRFSLDALQLSGCGKVWLLRVLREHEIVGSNPTILTDRFRCSQIGKAPPC